MNSSRYFDRADSNKSFVKKETHFCKYCNLGFRHGEACKQHEKKCVKGFLGEKQNE